MDRPAINVLSQKIYANSINKKLIPIGSFIGGNDIVGNFGQNIVNIWEDSQGRLFRWTMRMRDNNNCDASPYLASAQEDDFLRKVILPQRNIYEQNMKMEID